MRLLGLIAAIFVTWALAWWVPIPLGIPGEWTWQRSPVADDFWFSLIPAAGWAIVFCSLTWIGGDRIEGASRWERTAWLSGLFVCSFGLLSAFQEAAPPEFRSAKIAWVLYYPGSSGYFTEARKVQDTRLFLSHYQQEVRKGDVLHQGTHPPGLVLGYRGLMRLCSHQGLRQFLLATQPADLREAFRIISASSMQSSTPLTEMDRCVIWLAALVMQACAAATVIPLYFLLRLHSVRLTSWLVASFWPIVPAVAIFLPKSDACFPFVGCTVLALWLYGLRKGSAWLMAAAGGVFWIGMTLSLALLPVACLSALLTAWYVRGCSEDERWPDGFRRLGLGLLSGGTAFVALTLIFGLWTQCNLLDVWLWNYRNHAGFYLQFSRTYWKWLLVNPLELSVAVGLPITFLAATSVPVVFRNPRRAASGPFWMSLATWTLLWLTGKNMGEAARLWIFLMPWIIWSAGIGWRTTDDAGTEVRRDSRRYWLVCWLSQLVAALCVITRVAGFAAFH